jgi:DNA-damage-inducible protein J
MRVPNTLTAETLAKSERGEDVHHAKDAADLFNQLDI